MNLKKVNWRRALTRSWFYFWLGYGKYLAFPMLIMSFSSNVFNLTVKNIPFLLNLVPKFHLFIVYAVVSLYPSGALLGWFHYKKSPFYKAEQEIIAESSPFTTNQIPELNIVVWELFVEQARSFGRHDLVEQMQAVIKRSLP